VEVVRLCLLVVVEEVPLFLVLLLEAGLLLWLVPLAVGLPCFLVVEVVPLCLSHRRLLAVLLFL